MRRVTAVTVGRSDWGILRPVLQRIREHDKLELHLAVSGAHLGPDQTIEDVAADGFTVNETVDMLMASDTSIGAARSMGLGVMGFADVYHRCQPDILLVLGDRFEMHAAALAAVPLGIPIAHIHGGEVTHGAIDDAFRHAMTKYSHLHFPSTQDHADRILQLGEAPWRITVSGAPALDNLHLIPMLTRSELEENLQIQFDEDPLLVTFHPVTLEPGAAGEQVESLTAALAEHSRPIIITRPNVDPQHAVITNRLEEFEQQNENVRLVTSLGTQRYFSLMRESAAMVGNSSSGIIEAASFQLPVVNIGLRQSGRPRSENIIDVDCTTDAIRSGIQRSLSPQFCELSQRSQNIYGDGTAGKMIADRLASVELNQELLMKQFYDVSTPSPANAAA